MQVGDYVLVKYTPAYWEGAGEDNIEHYIGHVGVIVEATAVTEPDDERFYLVRFPDRNNERTGQRNIESSALRHVSSPDHPLPPECLDN